LAIARDPRFKLKSKKKKLWQYNSNYMGGVYNVTAGQLQVSICQTGRESNNNNVMNANI